MVGDLDLLDFDGVASELGVKVATVYHYKATGKLPQPDVSYTGCVHWYRGTIREWRNRPGRTMRVAADKQL